MIDKVPPEIRALSDEIEKALAAKLYYAAIAVALSVPDICVRLELAQTPKKSDSSKARYKTWCEKNISSFGTLTSDDLYRLRCGVLHEGNFDDPQSIFSRVIFIGEPSQARGHEVIIKCNPSVSYGNTSSSDLRLSNLILLEAGRFCRQIIGAVHQWINTEANNPVVMGNLSKLVRYRPEGLPPFMVGVPLIA